MTIYDIDYDQQTYNLLPPSKRQTLFINFLKVIVVPLAWIHDLFFGEFADGFSGSNWSNATTYAIGDRVRYLDGSLYEAISVTTNNVPNEVDSLYWIKIQSNWVGIRERAKYNAQKLVLEYALNKWFFTQFRQPSIFLAGDYTPKSDIYIVNIAATNNVFRVGAVEIECSNVFSGDAATDPFVIDYVFATNADYNLDYTSYTIMVPVAVYNVLGSDTATREGVIRAFVDKYNLAGLKYTITTY